MALLYFLFLLGDGGERRSTLYPGMVVLIDLIIKNHSIAIVSINYDFVFWSDEHHRFSRTQEVQPLMGGARICREPELMGAKAHAGDHHGTDSRSGTAWVVIFCLY